MKTRTSLLIPLLVLLSCFIPAHSAQADGSLELTITIDSVTPPKDCKTTGWMMPFTRTTTVGQDAPAALQLWRYIVQYINDDINLVHYWGSGYSAYVQDYMMNRGEQHVYGITSYVVPLLSATYRATTVEYVLYNDAVVWEIRSTVDCQNGKPVNYAVTAQAARGNRADLPPPGRNLVLALEDIPLYRNNLSRTHPLGMIKACQTFYLSRIVMPRASITVYARESLANSDIILVGGPNPRPRLVDVPENYGQPGGQPILDQCVGK